MDSKNPSQLAYYMITNKNESRFGQYLHDGFNSLIQEFDGDPLNVFGYGFYFTIKENLKLFLKRGCYVREVFLPTESEGFKMITLTTSTYPHRIIECRSNMIVLGTRYNLSDFKTLDKFDLFSNNDLIDHAMREANLETDIKDLPTQLMLNWLKNNGWTDFKYTKKMLSNVLSDVKKWLLEHAELVVY